MALTVKVALPVPPLSAVNVTFCAVAKLAGVKVSDDPPLTLSPVLPEVRAVLTVTFAEGAADSEMPTVPVWLWATDSVVALAWMAPVVPVTPPVQVTPLRVNVVGLVLVPL